MKIRNHPSQPEKNSHQTIKQHEEYRCQCKGQGEYRRSPTKLLREARLAQPGGQKETRMVLPKPRQLLNGGRSERHSSKQ